LSGPRRLDVGRSNPMLRLALIRLVVQLLAMRGIRLEAPRRLGSRALEVSAPNWR
jgi:hypothetical protein